MDLGKALLFTDALNIGASLLSLSEEGRCGLDDIRYGVIGTDEAEAELIQDVDSTIATYLDHIGVQEDVITNLFARNDDTSDSNATAISKKFGATYTEDDIIDIAKSYIESDTSVTVDDISLDTAMVARKQGYKRVLAVRNGKKTWVNKRIQGKRIHLSPAQRRALVKARLKAHTARANIHRKKSSKIRKRYGLK